MPSRFNRKAEIGTYHNASDSNDMDNVFLTEKGWVYRHYKSEDFSRYWDEVLIPGDVPAAVVNGVSNAPLSVIMDDDANIHFENTDGEGNPNSTDGQPDITYSPDFSGSPKIFTPLGEITVTLTHNFPDAGNTIHDHEVGAFHAEVTFTPADDHPDATLDDVEDSLEFHWTHDGQHNDGDDIVGREGEDVSYQFDSIGHHIVSVNVTSDKISNSGVAGDTDEFEVYGHIDNLVLVYPKEYPEDTFMRADFTNTPSREMVVNYEGNLEGEITVTDVTLIEEDGFVQSDWYTLELQGDNTFIFDPQFAYDIELEITVEHENLSEPYTERVPLPVRIRNVYAEAQVPDLDPALDPSSSRTDWNKKDLTAYGFNQPGLKYIRGWGNDQDLEVPHEIVYYGYLGQEYPPERVPEVTFEPYDGSNWVDGKVTGVDNMQFRRGKSVSTRYYVKSPYLEMSENLYTQQNVRCHAVDNGSYASTQNYLVRLFGPDGTDVPGEGLPTLVLHEDDNRDKDWVTSLGSGADPKLRMNRVILFPDGVKTLKLEIGRFLPGMTKDCSVIVHSNSNWGQTNNHSSYFNTDVRALDDDNRKMEINVEQFRTDGVKTMRISVIPGRNIAHHHPIPDELWKTLTSDRSLYICLI